MGISYITGGSCWVWPELKPKGRGGGGRGERMVGRGRDLEGRHRDFLFLMEARSIFPCSI